MSKVAITGNASGTGVFTIASPNSNTDRVITLPDEAGTVDTLQRAGNVLQVVQATASAELITTSATPVGLTGMSVTITPTNSTSKMLVMYSFHVFVSDGTSNGWAGAASRVLRDSTSVFSDDDAAATYGIAANFADTADRYMTGAHYSFVDDHNSSSSIVYTVQGWRSRSDGQSIEFNKYGAPGRIIVMEIAA